MNGPLAQVFFLFLSLSMMALGGGVAIVPEMKQQAVDVHHWIPTERDFVNLYGITNVTPGPSMLIVCVVGYQAAGWLGAMVAALAMFGPTSLLMYYVRGVWDKFEKSDLRHALEKGLAPIGVGLMMSGALIIAKGACDNPVAIGITVVSTILVAFTKTNLLLICGAAALIGLLGLAS